MRIENSEKDKSTIWSKAGSNSKLSRPNMIDLDDNNTTIVISFTKFYHAVQSFIKSKTKLAKSY